MLGLCFCARAFSSCGKWGPLFIAVRGPLTIAASLVAEHRLQMHRLSNCGSRAQLLHGMWDLPRPGLEPVSPALAGRFSTTAPPGKPEIHLFWSMQLHPIQFHCYIVFIVVYEYANIYLSILLPVDNFQLLLVLCSSENAAMYFLYVVPKTHVLLSLGYISRNQICWP